MRGTDPEPVFGAGSQLLNFLNSNTPPTEKEDE
jgi:hypothetical protein